MVISTSALHSEVFLIRNSTRRTVAEVRVVLFSIYSKMLKEGFKIIHECFILQPSQITNNSSVI
jgi:hypothetical protein